MKHLVWILALAVAFAPGASAMGADNKYNLPQLGWAGESAISQTKLDEIGKQMLIELRRNRLLLRDPLITDYIRDVGRRIDSNSNSPGMRVHYYVINTPIINSFALPGGNVFIFTGMLLHTDNENELAGVIAHETAHVTQHHIARQIADSQGNTWKALAGVLGGLVLAAATGNPNVAMAATMGTQAALLQHQINFTRHEEAEADRIGISFMSGAGYDPKGMAQMFEKMEMMSRGELKPPAFLVDHPLNSQRITDARERARDMPASEHSSSRSYLLMRARARVLTSEHVDQALTWFKGVDRKKKTAAERDAIDYGRALCLIRLNRSKKALAILKPLLTKHSDVIALHLAVAEAELQRDRYQSAIAELEHTRHVFPDSLAVKVDYAEALLADNRAADAKSVMEDALSDSPGNSQVLQLLAKSATRAGDKSEGRYYQSQYYELNGELIPAINQIQLALNNPHISDYEHARYEARLDDLKKAHKEHAKKQHDQLRNQVHFSVDRAAVPPWEQPARRHHFRLRN